MQVKAGVVEDPVLSVSQIFPGAKKSLSNHPAPDKTRLTSVRTVSEDSFGPKFQVASSGKAIAVSMDHEFVSHVFNNRISNWMYRGMGLLRKFSPVTWASLGCPIYKTRIAVLPRTGFPALLPPAFHIFITPIPYPAGPFSNPVCKLNQAIVPSQSWTLSSYVLSVLSFNVLDVGSFMNLTVRDSKAGPIFCQFVVRGLTSLVGQPGNYLPGSRDLPLASRAIVVAAPAWYYTYLIDLSSIIQT
ncbi:uncharacterized protein CLUP02_01479 [Colletotrichum lupini]|uniref:Uncharacterized protein n=1 Tax=Colletotrichum lupini TaxID=145971 RepID=A0A9Q8W9R0_9PEZI|nr:uncharacterized protein CLUP02_01479 [Colletotrichum lupini]UQC74827.1 hypothetical protein CLUP02_01479 [Colletotrichum lupini]